MAENALDKDEPDPLYLNLMYPNLNRHCITTKWLQADDCSWHVEVFSNIHLVVHLLVRCRWSLTKKSRYRSTDVKEYFIYLKTCYISTVIHQGSPTGTIVMTCCHLGLSVRCSNIMLHQILKPMKLVYKLVLRFFPSGLVCTQAS